MVPTMSLLQCGQKDHVNLFTVHSFEDPFQLEAKFRKSSILIS